MSSEMTLSMQEAIVRQNVRSVFHPTDLSDASDIAFAHALKFALIAKSDLNILHVTDHVADLDWSEFPAVRDTLTRWRLIPPGTKRHAVAKLGIKVRKVISDEVGTVQSCVKFLENKPADVIVLATSQRGGLMGWFRRSVSEPIARAAGDAATLFVPHGVDGFISAEDGSVSLKRILIPIHRAPDPVAAVTVAARMATVLQCPEVTFTLVHVGDKLDMPVVKPLERDHWTWKKTSVADGDVVDTILGTAEDTSSDLIVMSTAGRGGFLDALRGSMTERVMREAHCPLLAIPEERAVPR